MSQRICLLMDVRYIVVSNKFLSVWKVDNNGQPCQDVVYTKELDKEEEFELWRCNNCGRQRDNYVAIRQHLGKINELIDPFNYPENIEPLSTS